MKKPKEKIKVKKSQEFPIYSNQEYPIEEVKLLIDRLIEEGWNSCQFNWDYGDPCVTLFTDREETDDEFKRRVVEYENYKKWMNERKIETEQRERKLLEQLKKRYETP
jgi:hypothetical protein